MKSHIEITIRAPYERIFKFGSEVERWGEILPHYRYVRLLRREKGIPGTPAEKGQTNTLFAQAVGERKLVKMSALRDFIPVTWTAVEMVIPGTPEKPGRVLFHHVGGLVRGMDVEWSFKPGPAPGEWVVRIYHQLDNPPMPVRLLGSRLIELIVGKTFIGYIAGKTLKRIKELAEKSED